MGNLTATRIATVGLAALIASGAATSALSAQSLPAPVGLFNSTWVEPTDVTRTGGDRTHASPMSATVGTTRRDGAPWWAPVASLILPGAGQFMLGQQRAVAYAVAEAYLVLQSVASKRDGDRDRDEYRAIAADVARRPFSADRPTGPWSYYEVMSEQLESGRFDRIPGGGIDPETDESTYNGESWRLARENFWEDPDEPPPVTSAEYQRALDFYASRAVRDEFRWSWRDAQLQRDLYSQTITSANRSYKRSVNMIGLVGANHLTSLIDAYVTVRIRRYGGVRVAGLTFDRMESGVRSVGDPLEGRVQLSTGLRFVPTRP